MPNKIRRNEPREDKSMTVAGHLAELRKRLAVMILALLGFSLLAFVFVEKFVDMMLALSEGFEFVYLAPAELVTAYLKFAVVLGLVFSSPIILWQIWAFVSPGLEGREKNSVLTAIVAGFVFFLLGALFCYLIVLPMTLQFFYNFNGSTDITANISFSNYMGFVLSMLVVFGLVFEMPVLAFMLARLGILKGGWLRKGRKYAILLVFIVAAIITPPDVVSQLMTALPMLLLYELSIYVSAAAEKLWQKEQAKKQTAEETALAEN